MDDREIPPEAPKKNKAPFIILALGILLAAAGVGVYFLYPGLLPVAEVPDAGPAPAPVVDAGPAEPSVDLAQGNAMVDEAAKGVFPDEWLKGGDAIRRLAATVYQVSEGESPRVMLNVLAPEGQFTVDEKKGKKRREKSKYFISAKSDARYDAVTKAISGIDAAAVGERYAKFRPYLDAAFKEVAPPGKTFDAAFTAAVDLLASTPIADGPREVMPMHEGLGYAYVDPKLEGLTAAQKHLLRMGPANARAIVVQLKAFRAAMK